MHKAMWLWRASHHNPCAQQVHQLNTRDLATAKPSRVGGGLKEIKQLPALIRTIDFTN